MKIKLKTLKPYPPQCNFPTVEWTRGLPFNVNPRGILIHRVKGGRSHLDHGRHSHDSVEYWCGNHACGQGIALTDNPPSDRLLCVHCERKAVEAGEPPADQLAGRHVHIGSLKAYRECCRKSDLN